MEFISRMFTPSKSDGGGASQTQLPPAQTEAKEAAKTLAEDKKEQYQMMAKIAKDSNKLSK